MLFQDRIEAGRHLVEKLTAYKDNPNVLVSIRK
jgi:predicted phosphoribosyltransferase